MDSRAGSLVLHPDGDVVEVNLHSGGDPLAVMREHLNCRLLDCVGLTSRLDMWVDDEGLGTQPVNPLATLLARHYGFTHQPYFGSVLLCSVDGEGDSVDLTRHQLIGLAAHLLDIARSLDQ